MGDPRIEIRNDHDGGLDEIVLRASDGEVVMHLEFMDDDQLMILLYAGEQRVRVVMWTNDPIHSIIEDESPPAPTEKGEIEGGGE